MSYTFTDLPICIMQNVQAFANQMTPEYFLPAAQVIIESVDNGKRVHIMGIGKPSYVAGYGAALMSSISVPAYYLDGVEVVHGSAGQLSQGDVVICISNSGETQEMRIALQAILQNGATIVGISRNESSYLAQHAHVHLTVRAEMEGGPLNRAPISSVVLECMALQGLSVYLEMHYGLTAQEYVRRHPGGKLGQLRPGETQEK